MRAVSLIFTNVSVNGWKIMLHANHPMGHVRQALVVATVEELLTVEVDSIAISHGHLLCDGVSNGVDVAPDELLGHRLCVVADRLRRRQDDLRRQPLRQGLDLQGSIGWWFSDHG